MVKVHPLRLPPPNAQNFFTEIADGLDKIYGPAAAGEYLARAKRSFTLSLMHPAVEAYAVTRGGAPAGLILGIRREEVGEISLLHVLQPHAGLGLEKHLLKALVKSFQDSGLNTILFENVSTCALDLDQAFEGLRFEQVRRELMLASLQDPRLATAPALSLPCRLEDRPGLARCIVAAYQGHLERRLHSEVNDAAAAERFVERVVAGNYGFSHEEFRRVIRQEGHCEGGILGCMVAPDTGFVLQVVVRPEVQGRGLGRHLLLDLAGQFRHFGLRQVGLGVTLENPARSLYLSLGFRPVLPVQAFVWWRPGCEPA